MDRWRGRWALVTGASAGIGWELSKQLAAGGTNLVLTARRRERLEKLGAELRGTYGVQVEVVTADLGRPEAPGEIFAFTVGKRIGVELLVNNAGFGAYGRFHELSMARQLEMVQVNCSAVVHLTHLYLAAMIERRCGDVLIVSSTASFQAVPYMSVYAATKSFDLIFAEGLAEEVRGYGIHVCALCPGTTTTEFQQVAGTPNRALRHIETSDKVARIGLEALAKGKSYVISGLSNYLGAHGERLVPRRFVTRVAAKMFEPRAGA